MWPSTPCHTDNGGMQDLLDEIERGALDESTLLTSVFKTCLVLARETGSFQLRDWARSELKGYHKSRIRSDDWTPPYRRNIPVVRTDRTERGQAVQETCLIRPVDGLESAAASTSDMIYHWQDHGMMIKVVGATSVHAYQKIVEQIRTALVGMVAEVRETPTQEALDRAVAYIRTGDREAQIVLGSRFRQFFRG